ncbi:MAG: MarR family transcriptional regulator [Firmicutes bacterium]|nr:MarR family transcriptional regulator [Bacillota bacterium]
MNYFELAVKSIEIELGLQKLRSKASFSDELKGELVAMYFIEKYRDEGSISPKKLSEEMGVTSAYIANVLNGLEGKGYITREIDKGDRRQIIVQMTKEGKDILQEKKQMFFGKTALLLEKMGEEDAKNYIRIKEKILNIVTENTEELIHFKES